MKQQNMSELLNLLLSTSELLTKYNESTFAAELKVFAEKITSGSPQSEVARDTLKLFAGMGSLSDVVIQTNGEIDIQGDEDFQKLKQALHNCLVELL